MTRKNHPWKPRRGLRLTLRRSAALWWAMTIGLALLTTVIVSSSLGTATRAAAAWGSERQVWVVQEPIDTGDVIGAASVRRRRLPRGVVPEGALGGESSPLGEATRVALHRGEIVLRQRLAGRGARGVAAMVAPGYRAVALPYDDQMPAVVVGDRVDVLATFDVGDEAGDAPSAPSFTLARAVEVLAVTARAVTVAVEVDDAPRVAFALAKGAIALALRGGEISEPPTLRG